MSLYNLNNPLTAPLYDVVNATNSNPPPLTATGMENDAQFRGAHTVATPPPPNTMKGGYIRKKKSAKATRRTKTVASILGTSVSPYRASNRSMGMTLARGMSGGRSRRRRSHKRRPSHKRRRSHKKRRSHKRRRGGMGGMNQGFPTGYGTPAPLNPNESYLATPPPPVPTFGS